MTQDSIIVFDLDGTIADCSQREHLAQAGRWDEFHSAAGDDRLHRDTFGMFLALQDHHDIWVVTARPESYRGRTLAWLQAHQLYPDELLMRPDNDWRPSEVLKVALLEEALGSKEQVLDNVLLCFEDRDKCVEAIRNYGLNCWQVRNGAY